MSRLIEMVGKRFGPRVVLEYNGKKKWVTQCDCGEKVIVAGADLRRGRIKKCSHANGVHVRFFSLVVKTDWCWLWLGSKNNDGYGRFRSGGRIMFAHRWAWEAYCGNIPDGMEIGHVCRNRGCVRPDHLEPVTHRENVLRGNMRSVVSARGYSV